MTLPLRVCSVVVLLSKLGSGLGKLHMTLAACTSHDIATERLQCGVLAKARQVAHDTCSLH